MSETLLPPPATADEVDLSGLTGSLGFLIRLAQVQVYEFFFDDLAEYGLRPAEFSALWVIHRNPGIRQGLLAQSLRIKRANMAKMIRGFEERGFVARAVPDDDRRGIELRLSAAGERFVRRHAPIFYAHDRRRPSPLDAHEEAALAALLRKFTGLAREAAP
jgi:DNA-binding MarR family transcriptional regulator